MKYLGVCLAIAMASSAIEAAQVGVTQTVELYSHCGIYGYNGFDGRDWDASPSVRGGRPWMGHQFTSGTMTLVRSNRAEFRAHLTNEVIRFVAREPGAPSTMPPCW